MHVNDFTIKVDYIRKSRFSWRNKLKEVVLQIMGKNVEVHYKGTGIILYLGDILRGS